jgi:hypothetical protein
LAEVGTTFNDVIYGFAVALLTRDFAEGLDYPTLKLEAIIEADYTPEEGVGQVGFDYIELNVGGILNIQIDNLEGVVVGIQSGEADVFELVDGAITINADDYEVLYLVVINLNRAASIDDCADEFFTVFLNAGSQPDTPIAQTDAGNFEFPEVGEGTLAASSGDAPDYLIPDFVPNGFDVVEVFEAETEQNELFLVVQYENEFGLYFDVGAAETDYTSIDAYLRDADFDTLPEEFTNIDGVRVYIADFSEPGDRYVYATFLLNGLRYEVTGDILEGEIRNIVASVIRKNL